MRSNLYRAGSLLFFAALPIPLIAAAHSSPERDAEEALQALRTVPYFAFGGIGIAGRTSPGELGYRALAALPRDSAIKAFEELYRSGNMQARCYALVGLRRLDQARFEALLRQPRDPDVEVRTMRGCIAGSERFGSLLAAIARGDYPG